MTSLTTARQAALAPAAALLLALTTTPHAEAALVTYDFTGAVAGVGFLGGPQIGSLVTGRFTWDTLSPLTNQLVNQGGYANAMRAFTVNFENNQSMFSNNGGVGSTKFPGSDSVELLNMDNLNTVFGMMPVSAGLRLEYDPGAMFANNDATKAGIPTLPLSGLIPGVQFGGSSGFVSFLGNNGVDSVLYHVASVRFVSSVATVPTPSTLALVGAAMLAAMGLAGAASRRIAPNRQGLRLRRCA